MSWNNLHKEAQSVDVSTRERVMPLAATLIKSHEMMGNIKSLLLLSMDSNPEELKQKVADIAGYLSIEKHRILSAIEQAEEVSQ